MIRLLMLARVMIESPSEEATPAWYGRAWFDFDRGVFVCAPLGLNWLAGWIRNVWRRLRQGPEPLLSGRQILDEARGFAESAASLAAVCERRYTLERVRREYAWRN